MTRTRSTRYRASLAACGIVISGALPCLGDAPSSRPNIVVILSDDMGYSDIGCYGGEIETPSLDRLAAGGLRFTQFYNTGRCCPTRASLLTGLYPHQAGVGHMIQDRGHDGYRGGLNRRCATIAEVLRPAGYGTYAAGKWHLVRNVHCRPEGPKDNWPLERGFDRFYGTLIGGGSYFDPGALTRDNHMISALADPEYRPEQFYYTHAITDHAVRFIGEHCERTPEKPFFIYVAYTAAHWPMHALERDMARYRGRYDEGYEPVRLRRLERMKELGLIDSRWEPNSPKGEWEKEPHKQWEARCMEVYAAMITAMDQGIGRIVEALEHRGKLENTLILYLQDNGGCQEEVGRKGNGKRPAAATRPAIPADTILLDVHPKQDRAGFPTRMGPEALPGPADTYIAYGRSWASVSNTPFRGHKHLVHEGGIATPLIAHWPAGIRRRGELEREPGHLVDVMATCVELAGAEYPRRLEGEEIQPMEGVSLVPALADRALGRRAPLFWEHEGNRAVRDGKWKLVAREDAPWELHDIEADRTEMRDLAAAEPGRVKDLAAKWEAWAARANVLPLGTWKRPKRGFDIPLLDLNADGSRQIVVDREKGQYLGHPSTALLDDGRTILCVYPKGHGRGPIVYKRSPDGGRTWSPRLPTPASWTTSLETPTIHRVIGPGGERRLILFSGLHPIRLAVSADDGAIWSELRPAGDFGGIVAMGSVVALKGGAGQYLALFHDDGRFFRPGGSPSGAMTLYKTLSMDGGLTWSPPESIFTSSDVHLCEPGAIRSPDGKQLTALLRENRRLKNSHAIVSGDEGRTWSAPRELPGALTGDRHTGVYAPDGRLFVSFRDTALETPTKGDWVAWVGAYEDIGEGRDGQYRVRLKRNHRAADCGYPGVERLADGTIVATTYGHWEQGEQPYIICVRLRLEELDALAAERSGRSNR